MNDSLKKFGRFGYSSEDPDDLLSLFANKEVDERMTHVRDSIIAIRNGWDRYDEIFEKVCAYLLTQAEKARQEGQLVEVSALEDQLSHLRANRDWVDRRGEPDSSMIGGPVDHAAVKLYTSDWYDHTFGVAKRVFRRGSPPSRELLDVASFLIELVNIDLYNCWRLKSHGVKDFEGIVHRGLVLAPSQWKTFTTVYSDVATARKFAVPLALDSASRNLAPAIAFVERNLKQEAQIPVMKRIHIIGLTEPMLELYRKIVGSTVSTICAAPLREISHYADEDEVLVRGGFFQLLRLGASGLAVGGRPLQVVDCVMLNSNRDHFSTPQVMPGDEAATARASRARHLFGALVELRRAEFCMDYCLEYGLYEDAVAYRSYLKARSQGFRSEYGTLPL